MTASHAVLSGAQEHAPGARKPATRGGPPYCVRVPRREGLALRAQCVREGVSVAQFLRDCLRAYLDDRVHLDAAADAPAPGDAATPPASMPVCTRLSFQEQAALLAKADGDPSLPARLVRACVTAYLAGRLRITPSLARPSYFAD